LSKLWTNISSIKWIVYQAKKIGIQSLFVSIQFKIDQIVCAWPNIAVTQVPVAWLTQDLHDHYLGGGAVSQKWSVLFTYFCS